MADREVNDDYLTKEQPNEEWDEDIETEVEKANNVWTYTIFKEILSLRAQGLKKKLKVNYLGWPIEKSFITFETYIGYLART